MSPKLEVRDTGKYGKGVFVRAGQRVRKDEMLFVMGGEVIPASSEVGDHGVQISETMVLATPNGMPPTEADFLNHSCAPNAGFRGQIMVVAMSMPTGGAQVTFDYAMCLHPIDGAARYEMPCACGAKGCRGVITEDDWKRPDLQRRYDGYFQWFLQEKIERQRRHSRTRKEGPR
jgi:hypothetical protein